MNWIQKTKKIVHVCVVILLAAFAVLGLMGRYTEAVAVLFIGAMVIGMGYVILLIGEDMVQAFRSFRKKSATMEDSGDLGQVPADIESELTATAAFIQEGLELGPVAEAVHAAITAALLP
jgi:hypothetical protein